MSKKFDEIGAKLKTMFGGYVGVMGFLLGASSMFVLTSIENNDINAPKNSAAVQTIKHSSPDINDVMKYKTEAIQKINSLFPYAKVTDVYVDNIANNYLHYKTNGKNNPMYYDPQNKYIIVGLVLNPSKLEESAKEFQRLTTGSKN